MTTTLQNSPALDAIAQRDPAVADLIAREQQRQETTLEMIASENHTSPAVMAAVGSCLTNKYAEGYPGRRYYNGTDLYDDVEKLAIDRACDLFGCKFANVQPHSGANANLAVFLAALKPGDTFMSVVLSDGGHLTHGSPVNLSGLWFKPVHYPLVYDADRPDRGHIDYDAVERLAAEHKPRLIMCGYSAYPRTIDFARFRKAADLAGAVLVADIAHIAGLVAAGVHPSPFPHCDIVTTTTHKTLRGPRGGLILTNSEDWAKKLDKAVFPGCQGGPLMHVIAGKAVSFHEALQPSFKTYAKQVVANAKTLAEELLTRGFTLASGGTDNHLVLIDLRPFNADLTGKDAANWLEDAGIVTNMNTVAQDTRSPAKTSGVRLGTPALTTRGLKEADIRQVAAYIDRALRSDGDPAALTAIRTEVQHFAAAFPMPH